MHAVVAHINTLVCESLQVSSIRTKIQQDDNKVLTETDQKTCTIRQSRLKFIDSGCDTSMSLSRRRKPTVVVCWLLNVPVTCECISGTDLLRQFYVLPH